MVMDIGVIGYKNKLEIRLQEFIDVAFSDLKIGNKHGVKLLQFQNACGKYDDGVDNTIKRFYQFHDESSKCGDPIEVYQTIVKQLDFQQLN